MYQVLYAPGNGYMMLTKFGSCEPHVTTCLPSGLVSQALQGLGEIVTREVAGNLIRSVLLRGQSGV